jgi:hypothetical protein
VTAVITAQGENMNPIAEETAATPAPIAGKQTKATIKATRSQRRAPVTPAKGKAGKKAKLPKKATPKAEKAKVAKPDARDGSKTARILDLLKRPGGVTAKELMKATGWQPHSVRGFLSGTVGKKLRLTVTSAKGEDGERIYAVKP